MRAYLERTGYRVIWVRSGEEALTEIDRHPVRIIVLDLMLPGIDGFDVARIVRSKNDVYLELVIVSRLENG